MWNAPMNVINARLLISVCPFRVPRLSIILQSFNLDWH